jgi:hypothetical protein
VPRNNTKRQSASDAACNPTVHSPTPFSVIMLTGPGLFPLFYRDTSPYPHWCPSRRPAKHYSLARRISAQRLQYTHPILSRCARARGCLFALQHARQHPLQGCYECACAYTPVFPHDAGESLHPIHRAWRSQWEDASSPNSREDAGSPDICAARCYVRGCNS